LSIVCLKCRGKGHIARECYSKGRQPAWKLRQRSHVNAIDEITFVVTEGNSEDKPATTWILDSGATSHVCNNKSAFDRLEPRRETGIKVANGNNVNVEGIGDITITVRDINNRIPIKLEQVLYAPGVNKNLISIGSIAKKGHQISVNRNGMEIRIKGSNRIIQVKETRDKLFKLECDIKREDHYIGIAEVKEENLEVWHDILGHSNKAMIAKLPEAVEGMEITQEEPVIKDCETCKATKMTKKPFKSSERRAERPLELVHSDVIGPMRTPTKIEGHQYAVSFIDDYLRFCQVYTMKHKSETLDRFKDFIASNGQPQKLEIRGIQSDNGGEYISKAFNSFC
jgi:hypothetical protein